jgi:peptidoglycan/xylan/chitin deacetylase (PgdA/CDA1 family)/thiamine kinase-like enzyme
LYTSLRKYSKEQNSIVTVPRLIKEIDNGTSLIGIIEYIDGSSLNEATTDEKIEQYVKVLDYLTNATEFIQKESKILGKRSALDNLKLLPIYFGVRALWHPKQLLSLLKLTVFYVLNIRALMTSEKLILAHRDLHLENIIVSAGKIYLIDLEYLILSTKYSDLAGTMRLESNRNKEFVQKLKEIYAADIKSLQFIAKSIGVLIKWGLDDGFTPNKRMYFFLNYIQALAKQFIVTSLRRRLYATITGENKNTIILCYHGIDGESPYSVSYTEFIKQIAALKRRYELISLKDAMQGKNGVSLTFDDGFASLKKVASYLDSNNIPYALFALSDSAHANRIELDSNEELLSDADLREFAQNPLITIGCHTATHANLLKADEAELEYEIVAAKRKLQRLVGKKIEFFAYPKGIYTEQIIKKVRQAGYSAAFSVLPGSFSVVQNDLLIPRTVINSSHSAEDIYAVVSPIIQLLKKVVLRTNLYGIINYERR